ncbi:MAG TPA: DUF4157 domain-containing protein, partial [Acidimicrobiales bacterium]|nr:DUF4157 domain-containing protein [Acidimicrobiales bacterium]
MREREPARSDRAHRSVDTAHDAEKDPAPAHGLLDLQRSIGNRATLALLRSAQPKLLVGAANDPCEQEAETAARQVLTRLDATPGAGRAGVELETTPEPAIERLVMRRAAGGPVVGLAGGQVDRDTESAVEGARRGGRALEPPVRERMEGAFGADFSKVQVHSGAESASLNREMGARAFTIGSDIFLGEGTPSLSSRAGEGLLAHELTHTIQQGATSQTAERMVQRFPATALSDPPIPAVDWEKDVGSVSKSSEGASGGVYFVKTKNPKDPIQSLVLKPNFGVNANEAVELAPQLVLGDRVISSLFGIGAPTSRIVAKGTAEFAEIINLISSKDVPSDDPLIRQGWRPVSEAGAIIVMGAVPNATSLSSLAEQAMDDPAANERLHAALFSDTFLYDLGKLMVADMLIGNDDRMVLGAMNVGNMMVSSTSGGHKLYAIDSRAVLGNFDPSEVVRSGGTRLGGKYSTKNELGMDLGERLDDFFKSVMNWFHGGSLKIRRGQGRVAPEGTLDPADILWMEYGARKPAAVKSFTSGFNDGMATVVALSDTKEGQDKMKGITDSFEGQEGSKEVQYLTLKTHAQYMSKRAKGESQDTAGTDTASIAALEMLASFNPNDYRL